MTAWQMRTGIRRAAWVQLAAQIAVVVALLCLAVANIAVRATWSEVEDGVLWKQQGAALTAREIAPRSAAEKAGIQPGDELIAVDRRPIQSVQDLTNTFHRAHEGRSLTYTVVRLRTQQMLDVVLEPIPSGSRSLYFALAAVGIFSLLVVAAARLRRPEHQATLHFFLLTMAFFGVLSLSFSGRLDALDKVFYWGDVIATLLLPPLFLHFALMFPERPDAWARS